MTADSIPQKHCTRCQQEFPATPEYFTRDRGRLASHCKECRKLDRKEDRAKNGDKIRAQRKVSDEKRKDKIKVYHAKWHEEHKEEQSKKAHEYYEAHKEEIIARVIQYYQGNKEDRKAYIKQWKQDNPDKVRVYQQRSIPRKRVYNRSHNKPLTPEQRERKNQWARDAYAKDPAKFIAYQAKRRAKKIAAGGVFTKEDIRLQYKSQRGKCWHCGAPLLGDYHADHLYPLDRGGHNGARNIVLSCPHCNLSKGSKPTWEWNGRLL